MADFLKAIAVIVILVLLSLSFAVLAYKSGIHGVMRDAFERGYAVQCVGKSGYYWECEK